MAALDLAIFDQLIADLKTLDSSIDNTMLEHRVEHPRDNRYRYLNTYFELNGAKNTSLIYRCKAVYNVALSLYLYSNFDIKPNGGLFSDALATLLPNSKFPAITNSADLKFAITVKPLLLWANEWVKNDFNWATRRLINTKINFTTLLRAVDSSIISAINNGIRIEDNLNLATQTSATQADKRELVIQNLTQIDAILDNFGQATNTLEQEILELHKLIATFQIAANSPHTDIEGLRDLISPQLTSLETRIKTFSQLHTDCLANQQAAARFQKQQVSNLKQLKQENQTQLLSFNPKLANELNLTAGETAQWQGISDEIQLSAAGSYYSPSAWQAWGAQIALQLSKKIASVVTPVTLAQAMLNEKIDSHLDNVNTKSAQLTQVSARLEYQTKQLKNCLRLTQMLDNELQRLQTQADSLPEPQRKISLVQLLEKYIAATKKLLTDLGNSVKNKTASITAKFKQRKLISSSQLLNQQQPNSNNHLQQPDETTGTKRPKPNSAPGA